ncbi:JmjC domain-containing histone demethylation protein 1 [Pseudolycoriella hygida]|uniref:JmjC domain-containing histone demethylation protein 1 n=1 Tax=Pseudolycoriella hygida TaxID=35572 RepID=A0A9Q0S953_9DIPT|nr:JmjC domain-containing histone demethylation protein 1 [Pseudolycoriella hygida]
MDGKFNIMTMKYSPIDDPMLFTLRYVQNYIEHKKVDEKVNCDLFRTELLHLILWKSTSMRNRCVECGLAELPEKDGETSTSWIECSSCKRWIHIECLQLDIEKEEDETLIYFCVVCQANTPTTPRN